jgi:uncharacterized protein (DUF1499 family)
MRRFTDSGIRHSVKGHPTAQGDIMKFVRTITLVCVPILLIIILSGCAGKRPASVGVTDGKFFPCPKRPNCVSSMSEGQRHYIEPFIYRSEKQQAYQTLQRVLAELDQATIIAQSDNYLHVEFKSRYLGFVDDVEFYFADDAPLIHIRSASRLGYSDLGVNRKRMDSMRSQYYEALETNERTSKE